MSNISFRQCTENDELNIINLLDAVFEGWPRFDITKSNHDYYEWKFKDNPVQRSFNDVASTEGKIVGCNLAYLLNVKVGNTSYLTLQGTDLAVDPEYRGQGIFRRLSDFRHERTLENGIHFSYFISQNPTVLKRAKEQGRHPFPSPILQYVRIQNIDLHLEKNPTEKPFIIKMGYLGLQQLSKISSKLISTPKKGTLSIDQISRFKENTNTFCQQIMKKKKFVVLRSREYLNWRYCDPRGGNYVVYTADENDELLGYIVLRINRYNPSYPEGYLVDLMYLKGRLDVCDSLVQSAVNYFEDQKINLINAWQVQGHKSENILKKHGFVNSRKELGVYFNPISIGDNLSTLESAKSSELHFQYGDTDWI